MTQKNTTIAQKIYFSFTLLLLLMLGGVLANYFGVGGIIENTTSIVSGHRVETLVAQREIDHLNWVGQVESLLTDDTVTALSVETDDHKCALGRWLYGAGRKEAEQLVPALASLLQRLEAPHRRLHESAIAIDRVYRPADHELPVKLVELEVSHLQWANRIRDALLSGEKTLQGVQTDPTQCGLGKWILSSQAKTAFDQGDDDFRRVFQQLKEVHGQLHASALQVEEQLGGGGTGVAVFRGQTLPLLNATLAQLQELRGEADQELAGQAEAKAIYSTATKPALREIQNILHAIRKEAEKNIVSEEEMRANLGRVRAKVSLFGLLAVAFGLTAAFLITRAVIQPLRRISGQMNDGANEVAGAAAQVSAASTSLADGASEQAAALEESSSSLEEMAAMTRQNADNATQADELMRAASETIIEADGSMKKLTSSMEEISAASTDTQKIIKTIDEIAFQTNLLALNAAVEAARAGESGAGFAVVAEEVRSLAMRTAESAKSTSGMIESILRKIGNGSALVRETSESFYVASQATTRVGTLVSEIAAASREQAQGIEQVNRAISEVDAVTQHNAANAEESASASAQLTSQAAVTKTIVGELLQMVDGQEKAEKRPTVSSAIKAPERRAAGKARDQKSLPPAADRKEKPAAGASNRKSGIGGERESSPAVSKSPAAIIPFDDDDFEDF